MTETPDREHEEEARSLLSAVREPLPAPADVKARALRRLSLALPVPGTGTGGQGSSGPPTGTHGGAGSAAHGLGRALATRVPAWSLLLSFVAGGALVAAVAVRRAPEEPRGTGQSLAASTVEAARVAAPPVALPAGAPAPLVPPVDVEVAPPRASSAPAVRVAASATPRAGEGALEAERAVLDVARTALGRGDGGNALRATDEHARKFPRGALAEEREAMAIQALRLLHRDDEAQARLDRFRGRFPTSLIRPALEADAGGAP